MDNRQAIENDSAAQIPEYEYKGLMAQAWDVFRGDTSTWEDRLFYLKIIQQYGQPVLDVGCGTGRLLLDYLAQGLDVDGVDISPEMLALCRHKAGALGLAPALVRSQLRVVSLPLHHERCFLNSCSRRFLREGRALVIALKNPS